MLNVFETLERETGSERRSHLEEFGRKAVKGGLKTVAELNLAPVWVNPDHMVSTCRLLLSGHRLRAIGVVDSGQLVGTVAFEDLSGSDDSRRVRDIMRPVGVTIQGSATVRGVATLMSNESIDYVPAVQDGVFLGMVTAVMLLKEMNRTWDPLTGLSWSDRLREWGVEKLLESTDVTIVFIDLDDFGQYNKMHGHIVGDRVLQKVARYLSESIDERTDVLVRYGGDEFAIGTIRPRRDAEQLVQLIEHRIDGIFIGDAERPVSVSIGMFGGRRTRERENIHVAAVLDSLINLASKECMAVKAAKKKQPLEGPPVARGVEPHHLEPEAKPTTAVVERREDLSVMEVRVDRPEPPSVTMATLLSPSGIARGVHARSTDTSVYESVVRATINAIERTMPDHHFQILGIDVTPDESAPDKVTVALVRGDGATLTGTCVVADSAVKATAEATLMAVQSQSHG